MPRVKFSRLLCIAIFPSLILAGTPSFCAEERPSVEPRAALYLKAALEKLARAREFTYRASVSSEVVLPKGQNIQYVAATEGAVRRPDHLWTKFTGEQRKNITWFDGKTFTLLNLDKNLYAQFEAPGKIDDLFDSLKEKLGFQPSLSMLFHEDVLDLAMKKIRVGFYAGFGPVDDVPCHHLVFSQEHMDWQIWIAAEKEPIIKKIVFTFKKEGGAPEYTAVFSEWNFSPNLSDYAFAFYPPEGSTKIDFQALEK